jgi:hypothetical protein
MSVTHMRMDVIYPPPRSSAFTEAGWAPINNYRSESITNRYRTNR